MNKYDFSNKVALVTGGASGIGACAVRQFAANGAKVVIVDLSEEAGHALVKEIGDNGGEALFIKTDVTDPDAVQAMVDRTLKQFGRLDYAINNAGVSGEVSELVEHSIDGWHRIIDVDLNSVFYCMRSEIPAMLHGGGGAIVNTASIMGLVSTPAVPAYVAAKHGVVGLTKSAAQAYSAKGVRVNAVCPGWVETPMLVSSAAEAVRQAGIPLHPIGRLAQPDDIAAAMLFLCSDGASFITGGIYPVDGGYLAN